MVCRDMAKNANEKYDLAQVELKAVRRCSAEIFRPTGQHQGAGRKVPIGWLNRLVEFKLRRS
jgi:hypothetical protein